MTNQKPDWWTKMQTIATLIMLAYLVVGPPTLTELYASGFAPWMLGALVLLALAAVIALVPWWVPLLERRPHIVARVGRPLRWLEQWWRVVFAAVVLVLVWHVAWNRPEVWLVGLIAAVVFLLVWFIRELAKGISWLGRAVLWNVIVQPASEHFGVEATREALDLDTDLAERLCRGRVRGLSNDSLALLAEAVSMQDFGSREVVPYYPGGVQLDAVESGLPGAKERLREASNELLEGGWISRYSGPRDLHEGVAVWVLLPTARPYWVDRLRLETRLEVVRRSTSDDMQKAWKRVHDRIDKVEDRVSALPAAELIVAAIERYRVAEGAADSPGSAPGRTGEPAQENDLRTWLDDVRSEALQVLLAALQGYLASNSKTVVLVPDDLRLGSGSKVIEPSFGALRRGCSELERAVLLESWTVWEHEGKEGVEVTLDERLLRERVALETCWIIEVLLVKRRVWDAT